MPVSGTGSVPLSASEDFDLKRRDSSVKSPRASMNRPRATVERPRASTKWPSANVKRLRLSARKAFERFGKVLGPLASFLHLRQRLLAILQSLLADWKSALRVLESSLAIRRRQSTGARRAKSFTPRSRPLYTLQKHRRRSVVALHSIRAEFDF
jgi:hypothetical protein